MLFEAFKRNPESLSLLRNGLSNLFQAGFFSAWFDLASLRNLKPTATEKPIEHYALRSSWHDGYTEAIRDLFEFFERYIPEENASKPKPDFGALQTLLADEDISQEEYDELVKSQND